MRTAAEIVAHYREIRGTDNCGWGGEVLLVFLDRDQLQMVEASAPDSEWHPEILTDEAVRAEIAEYMPFAWEKATDHRGLSANRSIARMREWVWLLGDDELHAVLQDQANYTQYGAPMLKAICDKYDLAIPDDAAARRMAKGEPCQSDCADGCSRYLAGPPAAGPPAAGDAAEA